MYRKIPFLLSLSALVGACTLDKIQEGELCPPKDASQAKVYLFDDGDTVELNDERCPDAFPQCTPFTFDDQLAGDYYCFSKCQGRQIPCDGICTEIANASSKCKAVNNKVSDEQKDPDCPDNDPECFPTSCTSNICSGDHVMLCVDGTYQKHEPACPYGCEDGACIKSADVVCNSGELRCELGILKVCDDNTWTVKEICTFGCNEVAGGCNAASSTCTDGDWRCNGNNLEKCVDALWNTQEICTYSCDDVAKACQTLSESLPAKCNSGEKKCEGDFVSVCNSGEWEQSSNSCPNGCENGECKSDVSTPITGSGTSYCEGQILHYIDDNGVSKTTDCSFFAAYGVECQILKNGSADCVYNHNAVAKACKQENEIASPQCADAAELGIEAGVKVALSVVRCTLNSNNELVGVNEISISTCAIYKNQKAAILCASQSDGTVEPAVSSCSGCYENKPFAICDGEPLYDPALSNYDPKNLAACTKANCITPTNQSCLDVCHANGKPYCYSVVGSSSFFCSEVEMEATGSGG